MAEQQLYGFCDIQSENLICFPYYSNNEEAREKKLKRSFGWRTLWLDIAITPRYCMSDDGLVYVYVYVLGFDKGEL